MAKRFFIEIYLLIYNGADIQTQKCTYIYRIVNDKNNLYPFCRIAYMWTSDTLLLVNTFFAASTNAAFSLLLLFLST